MRRELLDADLIWFLYVTLLKTPLLVWSPTNYLNLLILQLLYLHTESFINLDLLNFLDSIKFYCIVLANTSDRREDYI